MVKYIEPTLDRVFFALSDPIRRDMISEVGRAPVSLTALSDRYQISLPAVMKHLSVLEDSGLVRTAKVGRERKCELDAHSLQLAHSWIDSYRAFWEGGFDRLGDYLGALPEETQQ